MGEKLYPSYLIYQGECICKDNYIVETELNLVIQLGWTLQSNTWFGTNDSS